MRHLMGAHDEVPPGLHNFGRHRLEVVAIFTARSRQTKGMFASGVLENNMREVLHSSRAALAPSSTI